MVLDFKVNIFFFIKPYLTIYFYIFNSQFTKN